MVAERLDGFVSHQERIGCERRVVDHHSSDVSDNFKCQADRHADGKAPCSVVDAKSELWDDDRGKEDGEEQVAAIARDV